MTSNNARHWAHINRRGQQELYNSMTDEERTAYDKFVQDDCDRQSEEYFTVPGTKNPATQHNWEPSVQLPVWLDRYRAHKSGESMRDPRTLVPEPVFNDRYAWMIVAAMVGSILGLLVWDLWSR